MATRKPALWVPERAEIIFIPYSPAVGDDMPDDHPMLVVSTSAFAQRTGIVVGFPMTHAERHADNPFAIAAPAAKGKTGYLLTHQPKSFDWRERNARPHPWGRGHTKLLAAALKRCPQIINSIQNRPRASGRSAMFAINSGLTGRAHQTRPQFSTLTREVGQPFGVVTI